jgi:hypothetical protein
MKKNKIMMISLTLFFLLIISSLSSADSCFLYKESPLYCLEVDEVSAKQECSSPCSLEKYYQKGKSCSDFSECTPLLCKDSCEFIFSGRCLSGAVPLGEEERWCNSGCCLFPLNSDQKSQAVSSDTKFSCSYQLDRQECLLLASGKKSSEYSYDSSLKKESCLEICSKTIPEKLKIYSQSSKELTSSSEINPATDPLSSGNIDGSSSLVAEESENDRSEGGFSWWWFIVIIILISLFGWFYHSQNPNFSRIENRLLGLDWDETPWPLTGKEFIGTSSELTEEHLSKMKKEFHQRMEEKKRRQRLAESGWDFFLSPEDRSSLSNLQKIVKEEERKKRSRFLNIQDLEKSKKKGSEQKIRTKEEKTVFKSSDVFSRLREVSRKR